MSVRVCVYKGICLRHLRPKSRHVKVSRVPSRPVLTNRSEFDAYPSAKLAGESITTVSSFLEEECRCKLRIRPNLCRRFTSVVLAVYSSSIWICDEAREKSGSPCMSARLRE